MSDEAVQVRSLMAVSALFFEVAVRIRPFLPRESPPELMKAPFEGFAREERAEADSDGASA